MSGPGYHASNGAAYEVFLGRWTRRLAEAMADFADFPDDGDLLDIGCGTGSLAFALAARGPGRRVVGVDPAEPYIDFARTSSRRVTAGLRARRCLRAALRGRCVCRRRGAARAQFRGPMPMSRWPRRGGSCARAASSPRRSGISAGGLVYQRLFWDTAAGLDPAAGAQRDRLFSGALALPEGLVDLFRRAGLAGIERHSLTIRMDYASFDDYWSPLLLGQGPVGTYVTALSPELRPRIEAAVRAAYLSGAPDGPRSMTATAWAVRGVVPPR